VSSVIHGVSNAKSTTEYIESFRSVAMNSLKHHILVYEGGTDSIRSWMCRKQKDEKGYWPSEYWYRVLADSNGWLQVYGDLQGPLFLQCNDRDPITWIRRALESFDYVVGKRKIAAPDIFHGDEVFLPHATMIELDAMVKEDQESYGPLVEKVREDFDPDDEEPWGGTLLHKFHEAWYNASEGDCEFPSVLVPPPHVMWGYFALVRFCELLDQQEKSAA